jgi:hypothetical protein
VCLGSKEVNIFIVVVAYKERERKEEFFQKHLSNSYMFKRVPFATEQKTAMFCFRGSIKMLDEQEHPIKQ